jgi:hypothetical protein
MACKRSELISAINTFSAARIADDKTLLNFAASVVFQLLDTLEFEPEDEAVEETTEVKVEAKATTEKPKLKRPRKKVAM